MCGRARGQTLLAALMLLVPAWIPAGVVEAQDTVAVPVCRGGSVPAVEQAMGTLAVSVQLSAGGGAPPPPGLAAPGPQALGGVAGVMVQALGSDAAPVALAEATTDAQGQATLAVPPGQYWVVVPVADQLPGLPGAGALAMELPSGLRVHAAQETTIAGGETVPVVLTIRLMLP
jgi:hypothetical protein